MNLEKKFQPIECACTSLRMASRVVSRAFDTALDPLGINTTQYAILKNIGNYQPVTQMNLADHLDTERTTLYRALDILENKGWIKSTFLEDGRSKSVELTKKGEKLVAEAKAVWATVHGPFVKKFGAERWEEFLEMMDEMKEYFRG